MRAIELAKRHGWSEESIVGVVYLIVGGVCMWQARWKEASEWLESAARAVRPELDPAAGEPQRQRLYPTHYFIHWRGLARGELVRTKSNERFNVIN